MYPDPQLLAALDDQLRRLDAAANEVAFWAMHPPGIGVRAWQGQVAELNTAALAELRGRLRRASSALDDALSATHQAIARAHG